MVKLCLTHGGWWKIESDFIELKWAYCTDPNYVSRYKNLTDKRYYTLMSNIVYYS